MLATLASDTVLDAAYVWLCERRKHWPADADVWSLRFCWSAEKARLRDELLTGHYHFELLSCITKSDGAVIHIWSPRDALVLKALAIVLGYEQMHPPGDAELYKTRARDRLVALYRAWHETEPTKGYDDAAAGWGRR